ncbi:hypothetical protein Tco_1184299 [Tanacetum coccineum]
MESLNSNSKEREMQLTQRLVKQRHSHCMAWFEQLETHLRDLYLNSSPHAVDAFKPAFHSFFGEEHQTFRLKIRDLLEPGFTEDVIHRAVKSEEGSKSGVIALDGRREGMKVAGSKDSGVVLFAADDGVANESYNMSALHSRFCGISWRMTWREEVSHVRIDLDEHLLLGEDKMITVFMVKKNAIGRELFGWEFFGGEFWEVLIGGVLRVKTTAIV